MRFICDVCPSTASKGQTVVIGHYEKWIRHLLSPQHQTEQNLVMARTSYWPEASWIALIKNLPAYEEATAEIHVGVLMNLSEYGFIEAVYYGSKTKDSICVALQWFETKPVPSYLMAEDDTKYEVKLIPRVPNNLANGISASRVGKRRFRHYSSSSNISEGSKLSLLRDVATSPISDYPHDNRTSEPLKTDFAASPISNNDPRSKTDNKSRIKYDRSTLLKFCDEKSMPKRFSEILEFPIDIIEEEAKVIDLFELEQLHTMKWVVNSNAGGSKLRDNDRWNRNASTFPNSNTFARSGQWNQNGIF